jgi:hypothetical protein
VGVRQCRDRRCVANGRHAEALHIRGMSAPRATVFRAKCGAAPTKQSTRAASTRAHDSAAGEVGGSVGGAAHAQSAVIGVRGSGGLRAALAELREVGGRRRSTAVFEVADSDWRELERHPEEFTAELTQFVFAFLYDRCQRSRN